MLRVITTNTFEKQKAIAKKRGKDMDKLADIVELLAAEKPLPIKNKNHKLKGSWVGYWECHIEPNWLLIYKKMPGVLYLAETGSHSDLLE